ncbi:MAG: PIN domain-containing protein [Ferruginibacter sp.]
MSFNIFVDSDVILDVLLVREQFFNDSCAVFNLSQQEKISLYTSSSIILNVQYVGQKLISKQKMSRTLYYLVESFLEIINPSKTSVLKAYKSDFLDFEDAVQYYTAVEFGKINYIITRNTKDYKKTQTQIPILTPTQFLKVFK